MPGITLSKEFREHYSGRKLNDLGKMETKKNIRTFAKLGYSQLDTAEIVSNLNKLSANYNVYLQKLKNFHWNVKGDDFFELYEKFEELYRRAYDEIDEIAGRIRLFGQRPLSTFSDYLKHADLEEVHGDYTSLEMVRELLNDMRVIISIMEECIQAAGEIGDNGTEDMMKSFIRNMEKDHWMFTAWLMQDIEN